MTDPATPSRSHRAGPPITLNWRHITVALMLLVDAVYVAVIASGVVHADGSYAIPAQINQMVVATLGVATLTAVSLVIVGRLNNRIDDAVVVLAATIAQARDEVAAVRQATSAVAGELGRVKDRLGMRHDDDPTVPLRRPAPGQRRNGHHYLSATVLDGGRIQAVVENQQRLTEALGVLSDHVEELGKRGAAGAPRKRRPRNAGRQAEPAAKSPTYSEGVLDGIRLANGEPAPEPDRDVRD